MRLSFCMIVKNEAEQLPQCLNSVKDIVDEMIVVDTGSTDHTPEIAKKLGAQVYYFEWCDDFAAARNAALKYVTGDWVLVLDADEKLVPEIIPQMQQAMTQEDCLLINLVRQEVGAAQSPYSLVSRLFRHHPKIKFSRPYHAMVDDSITQLLSDNSQWKVSELSGVAILHQGYQASAIAKRNKQQTAQRVMERYFKQHPTDPYVVSKLGGLYVETGEIPRAIELLEQGLFQLTSQTQSSINSPDEAVFYELHYHLGIAYRKQQNLNKAKYHYKAAAQFNIMPELKLGAYNNLANLLKEQGNLQEAKNAYEATLKIDPNFVQGYYNLGLTLRAMGQYQDAIAAYQNAIRLNPNYAEAYQNLGVVLLNGGKILNSLEAFKTAIALYDKNNPAEAQRLRLSLEEMGFKV